MGGGALLNEKWISEKAAGATTPSLGAHAVFYASNLKLKRHIYLSEGFLDEYPACASVIVDKMGQSARMWKPILTKARAFELAVKPSTKSQTIAIVTAAEQRSPEYHVVRVKLCCSEVPTFFGKVDRAMSSHA